MPERCYFLASNNATYVHDFMPPAFSCPPGQPQPPSPKASSCWNNNWWVQRLMAKMTHHGDDVTFMDLGGTTTGRKNQMKRNQAIKKSTPDHCLMATWLSMWLHFCKCQSTSNVCELEQNFQMDFVFFYPISQDLEVQFQCKIMHTCTSNVTGMIQMDSILAMFCCSCLPTLNKSLSMVLCCSSKNILSFPIPDLHPFWRIWFPFCHSWWAYEHENICWCFMILLLAEGVIAQGVVFVHGPHIICFC